MAQSREAPKAKTKKSDGKEERTGGKEKRRKGRANEKGKGEGKGPYQIVSPVRPCTPMMLWRW